MQTLAARGGRPASGFVTARDHCHPKKGRTVRLTCGLQTGWDSPQSPRISYVHSLGDGFRNEVMPLTPSDHRGFYWVVDADQAMFLPCLKASWLLLLIKLLIITTYGQREAAKANEKCHAWTRCRKHQYKMNPSAILIQMEWRPRRFYLVIGWIYMDSVTENLECWKMLCTFKRPQASSFKYGTKNKYILFKIILRTVENTCITWHDSFQFCIFFPMSLIKPNVFFFHHPTHPIPGANVLSFAVGMDFNLFSTPWCKIA